MKNLLTPLLHIVLFIISLIVPKSNKLWIFGAWFGESYSDNSKYLFEAPTSDKNIKKIWISKNHKLIQSLKEQKINCYHQLSLKGIYYQLRARYFFCSVNSKDFCFSTITPRNIFIQLWHGLPLKKIGYDTIRPWSLEWIKNRIRSATVDKYRYVLSPSERFDKFFISAFKTKQNKILRCNYPRCDGFYISPEDSAKIRERLSIRASNIFFYLPTHRNEGKSPEKINSLIKSIQSIDNRLQEIDTLIIIKPHYYENNNFDEIISQNIIVTKHLPDDLYACLSIATGIITDYSSIAFDFATTGKPILFFTPDLDEYMSKDREMYFNITDLAPTTSASVEDLLIHINKITTNPNGEIPSYFNIKPSLEGGFSADLQEKLERLLK